MVALMGASGVLSHTIISSKFPVETAGRGNTALHLLHLGGALVVQWATGAIVDLWQVRDAIHSSSAYQVAFAVNIAMQACAMIWFMWPETERGVQQSQILTPGELWQAHRPHSSISPYDGVRREWIAQLSSARAHRDSWWFAALGSSSILVKLMSLVVHGH